MFHMHHDSTLHVRIPQQLRDQLEEINERTRVPMSEVVRYLIESGLTRFYPLNRPGSIDFDALVIAIVEDVHDQEREREASGRPRSRSNAAA